MYPAHTQLVAKWSSPSIGEARATGCSATLEKKCWYGALVEKTVDLYNSLIVVGMACRRVDFTKAPTRHSRDTLQTLPDTIQTTFKISKKKNETFKNFTLDDHFKLFFFRVSDI